MHFCHCVRLTELSSAELQLISRLPDALFEKFTVEGLYMGNTVAIFGMAVKA